MTNRDPYENQYGHQNQYDDQNQYGHQNQDDQDQYGYQNQDDGQDQYSNQNEYDSQGQYSDQDQYNHQEEPKEKEPEDAGGEDDNEYSHVGERPAAAARTSLPKTTKNTRPPPMPVNSQNQYIARPYIGQ